MNAPEIEVDINDLTDKYKLVIRVNKLRRFALRMKLAAFLLELASKISPVEIFLCESVELCEAGFNCGDVEPYGFVPECGCPIHDLDESDDESYLANAFSNVFVVTEEMLEAFGTLDEYDDDDDYDDYVARLRSSEGDYDD